MIREAGTPTDKWGPSTGPLPTNAWFENFALGDEDSKNNNIFQIPYVLTPSKTTCNIHYPFMIPSDVSVQQDFDTTTQMISVGAAESLSSHKIMFWDELTMTTRWASGAASMDVVISRGSPYATFEFNGATPMVTSPMSVRRLNNTLSITVDGVLRACDGSRVRGGTIGVTFVESDESWLVFSNQKQLSWTCQGEPFSLQATGQPSATTVVRVAMANNCTTGTGFRHCPRGSTKGRGVAQVSYTQALIKHADTYPATGQAQWSVSDGVSSLVYKWSKRSVRMHGQPAEADSPLLMMALPHHLAVFDNATKAAILPIARVHQSTRGQAVAVVASSWTSIYKLSSISFTGPRPISDGMKSLIKTAIVHGPAMYNGTDADKDYDLPLNYALGAGDTYFAGKMLARLARIAVVAEEVLGTKDPVTTQLVSRLQQRVEIWLNHSGANRFQYDQLWGGLVACGCKYDNCEGNCTPHCNNDATGPGCPALSDAGLNFGNGFYNDHHFHYGYHVYAAAVVAKFNPKWAQEHLEEVLLLVRDFSNPSTDDEFFPLARHKDWYMGFSWAGGIPLAAGAPNYNGRNQESTSEAVFAYYAVGLLGDALLGHEELASLADTAQTLSDYGRLLNAMEINGANTYWHPRRGSGAIYDHYKPTSVGILWDHLVQYQTWFGAAGYEVHGIQQLPYSPISEDLMAKDWVAGEYPDFKAACDSTDECATNGWSWLVCLEQAILDQSGAKKCLDTLPEDAFSNNNAGSSGNSLTNALHWIGTRA